MKIFVINNNGYSAIRQTQRNFFEGHMTGSGVASGVGVPDFKNVAEAFGIEMFLLFLFLVKKCFGQLDFLIL